MHAYWLSLEVHLAEPLVLVGDDGVEERARLVGFVQELGVSAEGAASMEALVRAHLEARRCGEAAIREVCLVEVETLDPAALEALRAELQAAAAAGSEAAAQAGLALAAGGAGRAGVWFEGGRAYYSEGPP